MIKTEYFDYARNRTAAHALGFGDYFDDRWAWAQAEHPDVDWTDMCVFRAQILVSDLPDDPKRDELIKRVLLVAEPSAVDTFTDGSFVEACNRQVDKETAELVVMPSAVYFMDGRIRRAVMMCASYGILSGIKLCRVAGGNPELPLATPEGRVVLSLDEAREGINRMMRLEVGDAVTLPSATNVGPHFTDSDIAARIRV